MNTRWGGRKGESERAKERVREATKPKQLLRERGGACSLPGVGGGVRCPEQRRTRGQNEIDLEPGDMITRRGKAVLE